MRQVRNTHPQIAGAFAAVGALLLLASCGESSSMNHHGVAPMHSTMPSTNHSGMPGMGGMSHADGGMGLRASEEGFTLKPLSPRLTLGRQRLRFQILDADGMPQTAYTEDQTKLLHFYLVRQDLTGYQHLHPTLAAGTWSIDVDAAAPGPYRMYTDFIAKDTTGQDHPLVLSTVLTAPGRYSATKLPAASTSASADGLTASLTGTITAGKQSPVSFQITEGGRPVADLEQYLDSFAHLTALRAGDGAYQHVHPELTATAGQRGGPTLPFTVDLPETGNWRLFLQMQRAGKLHLLELTVSVR